MTITLSNILLPLITGVIIGLLYFAGLWQTVERLNDSPRPYRLLALSYTGRMAMATGGFYLILVNGWVQLAAALAGFLMARTVLMKILGKVSSGPWKGAIVWK
jgi:F1F0 ATPase subunit 2